MSSIKQYMSKFTHKVLQRNSRHLSDQAFLRMAYNVIFERDIDPEGLNVWQQQLKQGLTRHDLVKKLVDSPEFSARCSSAISTNSESVFYAIHNARVEMIRTLLPPAEVVLDLGGAHPTDPKGSLLNYGYPYLPKKLYIVDLPPDTRMFEAQVVPQKYNHEGCEIEYVYRSMSDLSCFEEESFDLIWSGESIEHIPVEEAEKVFEQVYKLLKPNGKFVLDTPNRRATILQVPNGYIHPEHKIEYYYEDFLELINKHNFKLINSKGIIDMTESIVSSKFIQEELIRNSGLNENPTNSYLFYICCMRVNEQ